MNQHNQVQRLDSLNLDESSQSAPAIMGQPSNEHTLGPEIQFKTPNLNLYPNPNITDTLLEEARETPLPPTLDSSTAIEVPSYLKTFLKSLVQEWSARYPYEVSKALYPSVVPSESNGGYDTQWRQATANNVYVLNLWYDTRGKKSREQSPRN